MIKKELHKYEKRRSEIALELYRWQTKNIKPSKLYFPPIKEKRELTDEEKIIEKRKSEIALMIYIQQTKNIQKNTILFN